MAESLEPAESPGLLLWRATLRWQRRISATLRPMDLTHVQFVLLASTWWLTRVAGEHPSQRRVAEHAGTDVMMTSQVIRALADKQLVIRTTHPDDARARLVDVTLEGADLARRAIRLVEDTDRDFFAAIEDRRTLIEILTTLGPEAYR